MHDTIRRTNARRLVAVALAAMLALGACGLGDRERDAERIRAARGVVAKTGARVGTITYELRLHPRSRAQTANLLGGAVAPSLRLEAGIVVDAKADRAEVRFAPTDFPAAPDGGGEEDQAAAALAAVGGDGGEAAPPPPVEPPVPPAERPVAVIFDGSTVYIRRQNLRPTERRTWARLDFAQLSDEEPRPPADDLAGNASLVALATTVNPVHLLDAVTGALAGSTRNRGPATIDGATFTRYTANVSFERATTERDLEEKEASTRANIFRLLSFRQDIVPAQFWLADDGSLRRMKLEIPQRVTRRRSDRLLVTLDIQAPAAAPPAGQPAKEETVTYQSYGRLIRAATPAPR